MGQRVAVIPFASKDADDRAAHIAQGLSLEFSDWVRSDETEVALITSAQTDEDGAWRRVINFQDELTASHVTDLLDAVRDADGEPDPGPELRLVLSGLLEASFSGDAVLGLRGELQVTDAIGGYPAARMQLDLSAGNFRREVAALFRQIADAFGVKPAADYDPMTGNFQAWLNLLITRALRLAAELGAVERDQEDVYRPALEAAKLDPALTAARDRLGELAQLLVLERGFAPLPAADALDDVTRRVGPDWKSERVRGNLLLLADQPDKAAKSFCLLIKGKLEAPTPDDRMHAALMAGRAFNQANRHTEAQRVLSLAMQAEQLRVDAIVEAGTASAALGEAAVAERLWQRAIELDADSVAARLHLAHLYRRQSRVPDAAAQYEALLKVADLPREVFADAAEFFVVNRMHETACATAERYASEYPGDAIAHVLLASSLNALGRHKRALKALDQAELCVGVAEIEDLVARQRRFAKHPETEAEFRRLADSALTGDTAEATRGLSDMVRSFPDFWEAHFFLGVAHRREKRWPEARACFELLRDKHPLPGVDKELTGVYSALDMPAEALACAQRALDASPDDPYAIANYAAALLENDRLDEALKHAQRAGAMLPNDPAITHLNELLEQRFRKRGLAANVRSVWREAASWFNVLRRRK